MNARRSRRLGQLALALLAGTSVSVIARAQPATSNAPVAFTSDEVSYDKTGNIITASGHVRAIQNGQTLYADKVDIDRTTDVVTATGHVVIVQPDGQSVYAEHAVLTKGMKNAVMVGVAARLEQNARMIANGGRRTDGKIDELSKVVYSACNLCKSDPHAAPTWEIRSLTATRDLQHKMIEYRDAEMEFHGIPFFYTPYLTEPDPSVKRQTGFLIPGFGTSSRIGAFITVPYYIVLDGQSDITLTPIIADKEGPAIRAIYRRDFNDGVINIDASAGRVQGEPGDSGYGDSIFSNGVFDLNQDWRAGFDYNHASNPTYLDDFSILPSVDFLESDVYLEGFSDGSYARIDADTYQGLVASVNQGELPIVTPHIQYDFLSDQDGIGGQWGVATDAFNIERNVGTSDRRISFLPSYSAPFTLPDGMIGTARVQLMGAAYSADKLYAQPNYSNEDRGDTARAVPFGAVMVRWPFVDSDSLGTQIIEPEVQLVTAPDIGIGQNNRIPNEDSLDLEYSDANLFDLNRYPGIDRIEGGSRVDYALHADWTLPDGTSLDGLIGQSYRFHKDNDYLPDSGLDDNVSDIVARAILSPSPYVNFIYRTRLSHDDLGARMIDATTNVGTKALNVSVGYLYSTTNPYVLYDLPPTINVNLNPPAAYFTKREDATAGLSTSFDSWTLRASTERNIQTGMFDSVGGHVGWENDCFGVAVDYFQRFTSFNLDDGDTTVLVTFTFKTLGNFGFSAL
jgi:LPS-assembly protein